MFKHAKIINGQLQNTKSNIVKLYNKPLLLSTYKSLKCISNKNHTEREDDRFDYTKFYNESSLANEKENFAKTNTKKLNGTKRGPIYLRKHIAR